VGDRVRSLRGLRQKGRTFNIPVGDETVLVKAGEAVKASLRTRDPREAKARFSAALTALNNQWDAIRRGPQRLSQKEAVALAGEIYHAFIHDFEENPAHTNDGRMSLRRTNKRNTVSSALALS
jgi:signal transduction protein with GAF and PtsI domain